MIGFSPDDVFDVRSSIDEGREDRVTWRVRAVSVADVRTIHRLRGEAQREATFEGENAKLNAAILVGVVGWSLPDPLTAEALDRELSTPQKYALSAEYATLVNLDELEKKASRSRPASGAGSSAKGAAAGAVTTNPTT
jgi:hypothetical protein